MYLFFHQDLGGFTAWTVISRVWAVVAATFIIIVPLVQEVRAYLGTQGVRVMNPPSLASGSHCRNIRTLCSRPPPSPQNSRGPCPAMGEGHFSKEVLFDESLYLVGTKTVIVSVRGGKKLNGKNCLPPFISKKSIRIPVKPVLILVTLHSLLVCQCFYRNGTGKGGQ